MKCEGYEACWEVRGVGDEGGVRGPVWHKCEGCEVCCKVRGEGGCQCGVSVLGYEGGQSAV